MRLGVANEPGKSCLASFRTDHGIDDNLVANTNHPAAPHRSKADSKQCQARAQKQRRKPQHYG